MKHSSVKDLFNKSVPELVGEISVIIARIKKAQMESETGKLKNTNLAFSLRKEIARIKTVIRLKEQKKQ